MQYLPAKQLVGGGSPFARAINYLFPQDPLSAAAGMSVGAGVKYPTNIGNFDPDVARVLLRAAERGFKLSTFPPSVATIIAKWKGEPLHIDLANELGKWAPRVSSYLPKNLSNAISKMTPDQALKLVEDLYGLLVTKR